VARAASLALVALGAGLLKVYVFDVLAAAQHDESVSVPMKLVILAPMLLVLGACTTVATFKTGGREALNKLLTDPQTHRLHSRGLSIVVGLLAVGFGTYGWMMWRLSELGYRVF
jgi:hypothetical protein